MKLNEYMIKAKTKVTDIATIKDLNCWGADLTDISIMKSLPNLEVLSLSVNCIESLEPLQYCLKLKKLYVRRNRIGDVKQISYLSGLSALTCLNLSENPICDSLGADYRPTVLRQLPNLEMLDETAVTPEELRRATPPESAANAEEADNSDSDTNIPIFSYPPLDSTGSDVTLTPQMDTDAHTLNSIENSQSVSLSTHTHGANDVSVGSETRDDATSALTLRNQTPNPEETAAAQRQRLISVLRIARMLDRNSLLVLQAMISLRIPPRN